MIHKIVEIYDVTPLGSELQHMAGPKRTRDMMALRDAILTTVGEGPYPKLYAPESLPKQIRDKIKDELMSKWIERRRVVIELILRRPEPNRADCAGGVKMLLMALQWAGWIVSDTPQWAIFEIRDEIRGEPKMVVDLQLPETDDEEKFLMQGRF